ncbi:MAG: M6 family metalloprotease domain-containing protein [Bacteroidales bacterium]|nr:M6 family metalloprotease domain-containing protein [Bacteroidales bacterium]
MQTLGDETYHTYVTDDGLMLRRGTDGDFYYDTKLRIAPMLAHNADERTIDEVQFIESQGENLKFASAGAKEMNRRLAARMNQAMKASQVPNSGRVKVPIIVVEYADKAISNSIQSFKSQFCDDANSARQYFVDQSNGKFDPQFDIFGVYTLSENRAFYGGNNSDGMDCGVGTMVGEACDLAQAGASINWADYDNDGDGICDVVIVVYAGVGEAQASTTVPESVWPCQWSLTSASSYGDGSGSRTYNGITVDKFAVFNEVRGYLDTNTTLDGIGTFCHEFSHCLGLPDFYMTTYGSNYGMGSWSLMDYGCYNNGGYTPVGYSAYEKSFFGWITLETPVADTEYTLPVFNAKQAATDRAFKLVNDQNENEYFVVENRRRQGWDSYIRDEGVMITHVTYVAARWQNNSVNNYPVQLMTIMPADGVDTDETEGSDLFGEINHEFTDESTPCAALNLGVTTENYPVGNQGHLGKPITDIYLNDDGTATFRYCDASGARITADLDTLNFGNVYFAESTTKQIVLQGENLTSATTLSITGDSQHFSLPVTSISAGQANAGVTVDVVCKPKQFLDVAATLVISNPQRHDVYVPLRARGVVRAYMPQLLDVDESTITSDGFRAQWTDATAMTSVRDYTLKVTSDDEAELLLDIDLSEFPSQTNSKGTLTSCLASTFSSYFPEGWTTKKDFYMWDGHVVPFGNIVSAPIATGGNKKITVVVTAVPFNEAYVTRTQLTVKTSKDNVGVTHVLEATEQDYLFVIDCDPTEETITLVQKYQPAISGIKIFGGDLNFAPGTAKVEVESGSDGTHQIISGILANHYDVTGLKPGTEFKYELQAHYLDGTSSEWTAPKRVVTKPVQLNSSSLGDFLLNAEVGTPVTLSDGTLTCMGVLGDGRTLITKDDNGYPLKSEPMAGQVDYVMRRTSFMRGHDAWDESNWILVELPEPISVADQSAMMGRSLSGVGGTISDVDNPAITATSNPTIPTSAQSAPMAYSSSAASDYDGNTYIAPNFLGTQKGGNSNADGTYTTYFFVKPKPNEIARVKWAMWVESEQCFQTPTSIGPSNREGLHGSFYVDMSKYEGEAPELRDGEIYSFEALITVQNTDGSRSKRRRATRITDEDTRYVVYPLRGWQMDGAIHGDLITGLTTVAPTKKVAKVEYVSVTGQQAATPFAGPNVVITTYTDGTRAITKTVK